MNRALPEMLHCLNSVGNLAGNCTDMTVLERQRARMSGVLSAVESFQGTLLGCESEAVRPLKPDPGLENGWPELSYCLVVDGSNNMNSGICRTASCPAPTSPDVKPREALLPDNRLSFKKRKPHKLPNPKVGEEDDAKEKRIKGNVAEEENSKMSEQNSAKNPNKESSSAETSKDNSKPNSEVQKPDYIHVRARRGQATDSHSLAERVRREKISERMKYLQDLVPGCNKITSKAGMLDEIINYVQSLQRQVEFLSMKLAAVNPRLEFNLDDLFAKEMYPACTPSFEPMGMSSEMSNSAAYLQFNPSSQQQQLLSNCGLEVGVTNSPDLGLRRTISAPVSIPEVFLDTSCFNQVQPPPTWDAELQNLLNMEFQQGRSTSFPCQPFTGPIEASNLKMEM